MKDSRESMITKWNEFDYIKNPKEYREDYSQATLNKIYEIIKEWTIHKNGISHNELAKQAGLNRKNLRKYTQKLMENNLIIREKGLRGKYLVKDIVDKYNNDFLILQILSDKFKNILFKEKTRNEYFILNNKSQSLIFSNDGSLTFEYDFTKYKQFFEPKFTEDTILEKKLFELSNLIGAYIVYLIIQAMNPDTIVTKYNTNDRDKLIRKFIEKGMFSMLNHIILNFNDITNSSRTILNKKSFNEDYYYYYNQTKRRNKNNKSRFTNTKENTQKLLSAYTMLYPLLSYKFERGSPIRNQFAEILNGWPSALEPYREYHEESIKQQEKITKVKKKQENCKHNYHLFLQNKEGSLIKLEKDELSDYVLPLEKKETDFYVKICSICNLKKEIRLKRESK